MTDVIRHKIDNYDAVKLGNEDVCIEVIPALGAKIISLRNLRSQREWMWSSGRTPQYFRVPTRTPFDQGPFVGGDECLPTVAACNWRGLELPDHGDAWSEAWDIAESELDNGKLVTSLHLPISPLWFCRKLCIEGARIRFDYSIKNLSEDPFEYVWAFHPMMMVKEGDRIVLPDDCVSVRTDACLGGCPLGCRGNVWNWPRPRSDINLADLDLGGRGRAVKLYTEPLTQGKAGIWNERTGDRLDFEFDANEINTLGIWINRGGFGGYTHVALEPTTGAPDPLDIAVQKWNRYAELGPKQARGWSFCIKLSHTDKNKPWEEAI